MAMHLIGTIPFIVYNTKDATANHYTPVRNGNEAAAYLQFIVDYYECLPHRMAFIHAHQRDMKVAPDYAMVRLTASLLMQVIDLLTYHDVISRTSVVS